MKIKKMFTGLALLGALAVGYKANAQVKLSSETLIVDNEKKSGVPFQRLELKVDDVTFKYDKNIKLAPTDSPTDVCAVFFNNIYSKGNTTVGGYLLNVGNFDGKDELFPGLWVSQKSGDITATLEVGKGVKEKSASREWAIVYFKSPNVSGDAGFFAQGSTFGKEETFHYFWTAYHDDHAYIGVGKNKAVDWGFLGVKGFKDFGTFTFAKYDPITGDVWIKNQSAAGNVNQGFFSTETFNVAANYFSLPAFFPKHFSPLSTKGNLALKLEYKNCPAKGTAESEVMVGTNTTPVQVSVGVNTEYKNNTSISGLAVELYKELHLSKDENSGLDLSLEARYNGRNHELAGYVIMKYTP